MQSNIKCNLTALYSFVVRWQLSRTIMLFSLYYIC